MINHKAREQRKKAPFINISMILITGNRQAALEKEPLLGGRAAAAEVWCAHP
jgi:hypothetical protein